MTRPTTITLALMTTLGLGCGQTSPSVRPDEMSAEGHRQEAAKTAAAADRERREADARMPPPNLTLTGGGNPQGYYYDRNVYDARNEHPLRARELSEHARQHERAATALEQFEEAECRQFPPATRAACPLLGPVVRITDIADGVDVELAPGTRVDAALAHMRCHLAFAQAHGFQAATSCPLYIKGIEIHAGTTPRTIEIVASDRKTARELQERVLEEAVVVRRGAN
jgi:hypothetical protein